MLEEKYIIEGIKSQPEDSFKEADKVFTGDARFEKVNLGFKILPKEQ